MRRYESWTRHRWWHELLLLYVFCAILLVAGRELA